MPLRTDPNSMSPARGLRQAGASERPLEVGRWQLIRPLGEGAKTRVYLARPVDAPSGQSAAYVVKMARTDSDDDPIASEMLSREATVGRSVCDAHLITVLASHLRHPPQFIVLPHINGESLDLVLRRQGPLSVPRALWFARQAASALAALHAEGWVHCDVKPANLMVSPEGHITLIDLGLARRADEAAFATSDVAGTLDYMAPEMVTSRLSCDGQADLYSLGVTLFEMLSGRRPFAGRELGDLVRKHRQTAPPNLSAIAPHIQPNVATLVRNLLSKEPLRRAASAVEIVERLKTLEIETFSDHIRSGPCAGMTGW